MGAAPILKGEKRIHPREKVFTPAICKIDEPIRRVEAVDAEILDISADGVCIMTERAHVPDSIVRLRVPPDPRLAEVRWVAPANTRFRMGLKFFR
jgi:hypothetical protein